MSKLVGRQAWHEALNKIKERLTNAKVVRVGFLANATYPDGKSVAMVAAIQDYGAPKRGIPPRPFFRNMIAKEQSGWPKAIEANLKATNYDAKKTLSRVGEGIAGQLKRSIVDTNSPPLKPSTIARKGFEKPLVDTGRMLRSTDYEVN